MKRNLHKRANSLQFHFSFSNSRPSNILDHFENFEVPTEFDLLSVDTDAYDWFMLETILEEGYRPRVIVTEYNAK